MDKPLVPIPGIASFGDIFQLGEGTAKPGTYLADVEKLETGTFGKNQTPRCDIIFRVREGDEKGKTVRRRLWGTEKAAKTSRTELKKLGITEKKHLDQTLPPGLVAKITVLLADGFIEDDTTVGSWEIERVEDNPGGSGSTATTVPLAASISAPQPPSVIFDDAPAALLPDADFAAMDAILGKDD